MPNLEPVSEPVAPTQPLTPKQRAFVEHYVATGNATRSAELAGYSKRSAHSIGWENLQKPEIKAAIAERQANLMNEIGLTKQRLLEMAKATYDQAMANGNEATALKTVELLGREHALFTEKIEQSHALTVYTLDMGRQLESGE